MPTLVFIDTNILLDFYRARGTEKGLSILRHIDAAHERIITTSQVEMEFKKNRQAQLVEALKGLKPPDWNSLTLPVLLREAKPNKAVQTAKKRIEDAQKKMKSRLQRWLEDPTHHDAVYKCAQRLFRAATPLNLTAARSERDTIRRRAMRRFLMGYPPRKRDDTSCGDAINWEWIIHSAAATSADVVIVSRDSDYGLSLDKSAILNDWLKQEFRERVGIRRHVTLTTRLTEGLRQAGQEITQSEVAQEEELVSSLIIRPSAIEGTAQVGLPTLTVSAQGSVSNPDPGSPLPATHSILTSSQQGDE